MQLGRLNIDLLVNLAAAEFAEHGFEGMSMRALAEKCSVTQPAIYYHFISKEALYEEVCRRRFDDIARVVDQRVAAVHSAEDKLEVFFSTLFDEWHRDNTILLLTQREVINALIDPERCVAGSHTTHLFGLIEDLLSRYCGRKVDEDIAFTFGSLIFGYCSLMSLDIKGDKKNPALQREHRKTILLNCCRKMLQTLATSPESKMAN
jgi:AcrR family transcriptional regulator